MAARDWLFLHQLHCGIAASPAPDTRSGGDAWMRVYLAAAGLPALKDPWKKLL